MTVVYDRLLEAYLGYAAVFACISLGLLFLHQVDKGEVGPGYWSASFLLNSLGFVFWSGVIPIMPRLYFLIGEVLHISGFITLVCGVYRFAGYEFKKWNIFALATWTVIWIGSIAMLPVNGRVAGILLKSLRALLFVFAGILILRNSRKTVPVGQRIAGWSLIAWGGYVTASAVVHIEKMISLAFGFLAGFQILAAIGLVVMTVDGIRSRAEASESQLKRLEGLLPICSHCKKIRDDRNEWHILENYIKDHSSAEFSHSICPECLEKYYPKSPVEQKR